MGFELHTIAQADHKAFIAKFSRPEVEGTTVAVPNIIDRAIARLQALLAPRTAEACCEPVIYAHGAAAR